MNIYSWGSNSHGQLGQNVVNEQNLIPSVIFNLPLEFNNNIKKIVGGGKHTLIVNNSGVLVTCGHNDNNQLGHNDRNAYHRFEIIPNFCRIVIEEISCGWDFNLAVSKDLVVFGWGSNCYGQLGIAKCNSVAIPAKIFQGAISISGGLRHSCVVDNTGAVYTSGLGKKGQLGYLTNGCAEEFQKVTGVEDAVSAVCGEHHTVCLTKQGRIFGWGDNKFGQLGVDPRIQNQCLPITYIQVPHCYVPDIIASGWTHCALLTGAGEVLTWGRNDYGQLGERRQTTWQPCLVSGLPPVKHLVVGSQHILVLTSADRVLSWGWNEHGSCGNANLDNVFHPTSVQLPNSHNSRPVLIGTGAAHSFVCLDSKDSLMANVLDLDGALTTAHSELSYDICEAGVPHIDYSTNYQDVFAKFLVQNKPCVVSNVTKDWSAVTWLRDGDVDVCHLGQIFGDVDVPVSDCAKRVYNVQEANCQTLSSYLDYWREYKDGSQPADMPCLYLKDWHLVRDFPNEVPYRPPKYFASDWLNEYYDMKPELKDDYRFVYLGPKGSWTPLHADVFTSFSWSTNICGRKRWLLFPPGVEDQFKDSLGNLPYDLEAESTTLLQSNTALEVIQEPGEAIFVPSGWHHQVWNLENTLSINHNWVNGCNIGHVWKSLTCNLKAVEKEMSDCRDMDDWEIHCQLVLRASFGLDFYQYLDFLARIANVRYDCLKSGQHLRVFGDWLFGCNHLVFDLRQVCKYLKLFLEDSESCGLDWSDREWTPRGAYDLIHSIETLIE